MAAPCLEIVHTNAIDLGGGAWRVEAGVANTGWLPTNISARAANANLVRPVVAEVAGDGISVVGGPARVQLGQLAGRAAMRFTDGKDGTPDRVLASWVVRAGDAESVTVSARHDRAGSTTAEIALPTNT